MAKPKKSKLKTYPICERRNLVNVSGFAGLPARDCSIGKFIDSLPEYLAARNFKELVDAIIIARKAGKQVVFAYGGHVVKTGCSPVIVDLIERGFITAVVTHGAGAIHDFEISLIGETSEDVGDSIKDGSFGMARETHDAFAKACDMGSKKGVGLGLAMGRLILKNRNKFAGMSILATAAKKGIPACVVASIGTDIVDVNPKLSPEKFGRSCFTDFNKVIDIVCGLEHGVWINAGSAVILPEVFLKAVTVARNSGVDLAEFTTANLDMIQHYRPKENVTGRPSPRGISITGHHEIMLPLLRAAIVSRVAKA